MNLEYLAGYRVQAVSEPLKPSDSDWNWALLLEGDVRLECLDKGEDKPGSEIEGSIIGEVRTDEESGASILDFYKGNPAEKIASLTFPEAYRVTGFTAEPAEERDPAEDLPPDPSADRVKEGPDE